MGLLDNITKNKVLTGLAVGVGASIILPRLLPVVVEAAKPLMKGLMKSGLLCFEKGKEVMTEVGEATEDMWAEVKAEMEEEHLSSMAGATMTVDEEDDFEPGEIVGQQSSVSPG